MSPWPATKSTPKSFSQSEEVAPRVAVTFGELIDELLYAGGGLGDDLLLFFLPQLNRSTERTFEQSLAVGCNRPRFSARAFRIATLARLELILLRRATRTDTVFLIRRISLQTQRRVSLTES